MNTGSAGTPTWDCEVLPLAADSREALAAEVVRLRSRCASSDRGDLLGLASELHGSLREGTTHRLAVVASSWQELEEKLAIGAERLAIDSCREIRDRRGVYYSGVPLAAEGSLAFLFPGEGSQYDGMLQDLHLSFPEVRECFGEMDEALASERLAAGAEGVLGSADLFRTDVAVALVFAAGCALHRVLELLGVRPHAAVGHSSGEFAALLTAGVTARETRGELYRQAADLARIYQSLDGTVPDAQLLTVGGGDPNLVTELVAASKGRLFLAMDNCPHQRVLCGAADRVAEAAARLRERGAICSLLPFGRPYHTPLFAPLRDRFAEFFENRDVGPARLHLYSCATAAPYPSEPDEIRRLAADQWVLPVRFRETVEALYRDGTRIFLEVGPRGNLTGFVGDVLKKRRHLALPMDVPKRSGILQLHHVVASLIAQGVPLRLQALTERRQPPAPRAEISGPQVPSTAPRAAAAQGRGPSAAVVAEYFRTMERFLDVQGEWIRRALEAGPRRP